MFGRAKKPPEVPWYDRLNAEFEAAPGRAAKLAVLEKYMGPDMAADAIGLMLGEHSGDVTMRDGPDDRPSGDD